MTVIVGSQEKYWPRKLIRPVKKIIRGIVLDSPFAPYGLIYSGGANGVDTWVRECVEHYGEYEIKEILPKNKRWEPNGYKARNTELAEIANELYCIRHPSGSHGSLWTANLARSLNKRVTVINVE